MSFQAMADAARDALSGVAAEQHTQALVLETEHGRYCAVIRDALSEDKADERELSGRLESDGDTAVLRIVCMWQDGSIDLPSYDFRKMLLELNRANLDAEILLLTDGGYAAKRLAATMPAKDV